MNRHVFRNDGCAYHGDGYSYPFNSFELGLFSLLEGLKLNIIATFA